MYWASQQEPDTVVAEFGSSHINAATVGFLKKEGWLGQAVSARHVGCYRY